MGYRKFVSRSLALGVAGLSLMACSGPMIVTQGGFAPAGQAQLRDYLRGVNAEGPVLVEVTSDALGERSDALAARIADAIKGIPPGINPEFTADPTQAGAPRFRVVYGFDVPESSGGFRVCDPGSYTSTPNPLGVDRLKLVVAFCYEDESENHLIARRSAIADVASPDFTATVRQVTSTLFRPGPDDRRGNRDQWDNG